MYSQRGLNSFYSNKVAQTSAPPLYSGTPINKLQRKLIISYSRFPGTPRQKKKMLTGDINNGLRYSLQKNKPGLKNTHVGTIVVDFDLFVAAFQNLA